MPVGQTPTRYEITRASPSSFARSINSMRSLAWSPPDNFPRPAAVYCDFEDLRRYKDAVPRARAAGIPVGLAPLRVLKPGEDGFQALVVRAEPDIVLVRNLASICVLPRAAAARTTHRRLQPERRQRTDGRSAHPRRARTARAEFRPELGSVRVDGPPFDTRLVRDRHSSAHADVSHGALRVRGVPIDRQGPPRLRAAVRPAQGRTARPRRRELPGPARHRLPQHGVQLRRAKRRGVRRHGCANSACARSAWIYCAKRRSRSARF